MAQKSAYRPTPTPPTTATQPAATTTTATEDLDDFLDEVDAVLEENVLEVLRTFVNRGGQ